MLGRAGIGRVLWARAGDARQADDARGERSAAPGGAAWLSVPDGVVGLAPPGAPLGPVWIRRAEPWPVLGEGDAVTVDDTGLRTAEGRLVVERRQASSWLGPLPDPVTLASAPARALISDALGLCRASVLQSPPWQDRVEAVVATLGRGAPLDSLTAAARALGGLGPGLTPAGDDALSGILFAARALGGPTTEPALAAVARTARTNDIAKAVLDAAAGGFHIEPVHDLVIAAAAGDGAAAEAAAASLDGFGSSSGADVAFGLRLAFARL